MYIVALSRTGQKPDTDLIVDTSHIQQATQELTQIMMQWLENIMR